jgi:hypothetical protein
LGYAVGGGVSLAVDCRHLGVLIMKTEQDTSSESEENFCF